jgi:hypothetical protein
MAQSSGTQPENLVAAMASVKGWVAPSCRKVGAGGTAARLFLADQSTENALTLSERPFINHSTCPV